MIGVPSRIHDHPITSALQLQLDQQRRVDDHKRDLRQTRGGDRDDPEVAEILAEHVAALDGPLAADRMIDVLVDAGYLARLPAQQSWIRRLEGRMHLALRTAVKRRNRHRPGHRNNVEFHRHRFPGVSANELREKIARFSQRLGRFEGVRVEQIDDHLFTLSA